MRWKIVFLLFLLLLPLTLSAQSPSVVILTVKGAIVPAVADYIERGIKYAEETHSPAVVILLDTPGGLVSSAQKIIQSILNSPVPVIVYVSPAGAWAGSAGAFITLSAHIAAMAPGTFIGAAHPVAVAPGQEGALPPTQEEKIVNALASAIRSIAQQRGRNVELAEGMVRKSVAKTADEALQLNLIDLKSPSLEELLSMVDGREVALVDGRKVVLKTSEVRLVQFPMTLVERIFFVLSDPHIAYILLSLSMLALLTEISNPGMIIPGVLGGIGLFLSLYSLGVLGAHWAGILLILLAFGLFIAEAFTPGLGFLLAGGLASFVMGSLLLFSGSPVFRLSPILIGGLALGVTIIFALIIRAVIRAQRQPQPTGREGMIGLSGVAKSRLNPRGTVLVHGELWEAISEGDIIEPGEEVIVTKINGLRLRVKKKGGEGWR